MALFYGRKSQYELWNKKISRIAFLIWCTYSALIICYAFVESALRRFSLASILAIVIVFGPIYLFVDFLRKKELSTFFKYTSGLRGEAAVWYELHRLNNAYHVFEDIKIPGHEENIDFVVIGPTGLFTIEVKNHTGTIEYNGRELTRDGTLFEHDFIKRSMDETLALHNHIARTCESTVFLSPIIVFSNYFATLRIDKESVHHVHVIKHNQLMNTILSGTNQQLQNYEKIIDCLDACTYDKRVLLNKNKQTIKSI